MLPYSHFLRGQNFKLSDMLLHLLFLLSATIAAFIALSLTGEEEEHRSKTGVKYNENNTTVVMYGLIEENCNDSSIICRDFKCFIYTSDKPDIYWYFKSCQHENCDYDYTKGDLETIQEFGYASTITIDEKKSGDLKCIVNNLRNKMDLFQEVPPNETENITILEGAESKFQIHFPNNALYAEWFLYVQGKPRPKLILMANNKTVSSTTDSKYVTTLRPFPLGGFRTRYKILMTINSVSPQDINTTFTVKAENQYEVVSQNLSLKISKSHFFVHFNLIFSNSTYIRLECEVESVLKAKIHWCFQPCLDKKCACKPMNVTLGRPHRNLLRTQSYMDLNSTMRGYIKCLANNSLASKENGSVILTIEKDFDIFGPENIVDIDANTKSLQIENNPSGSGYLYCAAPTESYLKVEWTASSLDEGNLIGSPSSVALFSHSSTMTLVSDGTFFCKAWTRNGTLRYKKIDIIYTGSIMWVYFSPIIIILIASISIYMVWKNRQFKKLQKEAEQFNVAGFEKGALEQLNPNRTVEAQAAFLPYDKRYEFPIANLKLGEQIGSGAFGVVVKARAKGIVEGEAVTTVAVKMVNRNIGDVYIKALASELKIMIHIGQHVNVVNLLGACTTNIRRRELLVIVEFCRFGNLKDYLVKHRQSFVDQVNTETGTVDFSIDLLTTGSSNIYLTPSSSSATFVNSVHNSTTKSENILDDSETPQSNPIVDCKDNNQNVNRPVCTKDLLIWSFQVARGMEYLSLRRVVHGDLAARNILLTTGNLVKICDFGLARNLHDEDIYKKRGNEMLPAMWMAIEAITDKIFSIQSDIWSYGIVLWEFFSLGLTPYPGMQFNSKFIQTLLAGYRMKIPQFAPKEIYEIMLRCWDGEPIKRPDFKDLAQQIGSVLEQPVREHYVDMNAGYVKMNVQRLREQDVDYMSMMSIPEFKKISSPDHGDKEINRETEDCNNI